MKKFWWIFRNGKFRTLGEISLILMVVMVLIPAMWVLAFIALAVITISAIKFSINFLSTQF